MQTKKEPADGVIKCKGWSIKVYMNNVYLQVNGLASMIMLIDYNNAERAPYHEIKTIDDLKNHAIESLIKAIKDFNMLDGASAPLLFTMNSICKISECLSDKHGAIRVKDNGDTEPCTLDDYWDEIKTQYAHEMIPISIRMANAEVDE